MATRPKYLSGKYVFIISLLVLGLSVVLVYSIGLSFDKRLEAKIYTALSLIASCLFLFMTYGLYTGIGLIDDFPKFKHFKRGHFFEHITPEKYEMPQIDTGDGIAGLFLSVILWIAMTILCLVMLLFLEVFFWFSLFVLLTMLYWVFFRAMRMVFRKSKDTQKDLGLSLLYASIYTFLYVGWLYGVVYLYEFWAVH